MLNVLLITRTIQCWRFITCLVSVLCRILYNIHVWNISSWKMAKMITDLDTQSFSSVFFYWTLYLSVTYKICDRSLYLSPAHSTKINIGVYFFCAQLRTTRNSRFSFSSLLRRNELGCLSQLLADYTRLFFIYLFYFLWIDFKLVISS